jgi:rod shape-determining protein MreD
MKESILFLPIVAMYLAVQSALFPNLPLPDVPLVMVVYMAVKRPSIEGALLGFAIGYMDDSFNGGIIGSSSFSLVLVFVATMLISKRVQLSTTLSKALAGGGLTVVKAVATYAVMKASGLEYAGVARTAGEVFLTGIFTPLIFTTLAWISSFVTKTNAYKDSAD